MATLNDLHILVVDDNAQMRFLLRSLLRAAGIGRVTEAETATDAFEAMTRTPIDLILVDWKMAPVDGLSFTRMVRHAPNSPNPYATILMLTAHTEASRVAAARDAGVSGFLKKPISTNLLFERLNTALTDQRNFIRAGAFFGPDRRFLTPMDYAGPRRRATDSIKSSGDELDLDDVRYRA